MDYSAYTLQPQFSSAQADQVRRIKKFLGNAHSHSSKERMREKLTGLYKQRARARSGYTAPAYGNGSMSNAQIDQQIVSGVRTKFGNEIDASGARQAQIGRYYDDWNTELAGIRAQQAQAAQAQIDAANTAQAATSKNEQAGNSQLLSQMQQDAASRGATVDPSLFIKANQASANRASLANAQTQTAGALKGINDAYYAQQGLINRASKQGALDKEQSYTSKLHSDAADYATQLRQQLDQASFDRHVAAKTLGLKAADQKFQQNLDLQNLALDQQKAADGGSSGGSGGGSNSNERSVDKTARNRYWKIKGDAEVGINSNSLKKGQAAKWIDAYAAQKGADRLLVKAAVMRKLYGGVDKATRDAVYRRWGFYIPLSKTEKKHKK